MPQAARKAALRPTQVIVLSFLLLAACGALLLFLPVSAATEPLALIDALFMAVSAVCVTGLATVSTGADLSPVGHLVILALIQLGGLGYMTISTAFMVLMGHKLHLRQRLLLSEQLGEGGLQTAVDLLWVVVRFTLVLEAIGAVALTGWFAIIYQVPLGAAAWLGVFHSVSAFCNAGLDLFGQPAYATWFGAEPGLGGSSLDLFGGDPFVMGVVAALIVLGGLGFAVVMDVNNWIHTRRRLGLHTRIVLVSSLVLTAGGAVLFWLIEAGNPLTIGGLQWHEQAAAALFQSVTCRTAGFSTLDQAALYPGSKMLTINLMFIGASPGGTGGGIKTTTIVVVLLAAAASIRGETDVTLFNREVSHATVYRALAVVIGSLVLVAVVLFGLVNVERASLLQDATHLDLVRLREVEHSTVTDFLFEATSAFGTVGLSTGITPQLSTTSKLMLIVTMLIGRVGPVTLAIALAARRRRRYSRCPHGTVLIG